MFASYAWPQDQPTAGVHFLEKLDISKVAQPRNRLSNGDPCLPARLFR